MTFNLTTESNRTTDTPNLKHVKQSFCTLEIWEKGQKWWIPKLGKQFYIRIKWSDQSSNAY